MSFTNTFHLLTLSILQEQHEPHYLLLEWESESQPVAFAFGFHSGAKAGCEVAAGEP